MSCVRQQSTRQNYLGVKANSHLRAETRIFLCAPIVHRCQKVGSTSSEFTFSFMLNSAFNMLVGLESKGVSKEINISSYTPKIQNIHSNIQVTIELLKATLKIKFLPSCNSFEKIAYIVIESIWKYSSYFGCFSRERLQKSLLQDLRRFSRDSFTE